MMRTTWMCAFAIAGLVSACSSSSSGGGAADAGSDVSHDAAKGADARHDVGKARDAGKGSDAAQDATDDVVHDAGVVLGLTCGQLLTCDQVCGSSNTCTDGCYAKATGVAQGLFNAFNNCISAQCAGSDAASCDQTAATGACVSGLLACSQDKVTGPADPDGGGVVVVPTDAGAMLNCGGLIACQSTCSGDAGACEVKCTNQATAEASALAGSLNDCLAMACPRGDGGVCATPGVACNGCVNQAEFAMPNVCATPFDACNADTSNSPDASVAPTALQDGGIVSAVVTGVVQLASTLIVQDGYLYFDPTNSNSEVERITLQDGGGVAQGDGGMPTNLGPPQQTPVGLAIDSNNIYVWSVGSFSSTSSLNNDDGTVVQVPLNGGAAITLASHVEAYYDALYINSIAVDSTSVYWVEGGSGNDGTVMRTTIGSPNAAAIYTQQYLPEALVTDGTSVYWTNWGTFNSLGDSNNDGTVMQGPVGGGTAITLASGQAAPGAIAIDSHNVYWTNAGQLGGSNLPAPNTGSVVQVAIGGGAVTTLATSQAIPVGIAVGSGSVFWCAYGLSSPGLILKAPIGGGAVVPLVAGLDDPFALTLSGNTLYWTNTPSSNGHSNILSLSPF